MAAFVLPRNEILLGDAHRRLSQLPAGSVDMVLTSPPYFRLRDYQVDGQLGLEVHVDHWVNGLRTVATDIARVLTPTGSFWLNLGDSYATHEREGASRKSLLLGPERLALALVADGWILRNKIVWAKTNPVPTSVRDRLACTWEVIYVLTRQPHYYFDLDAVRVPHTSKPPRQHRIPDVQPELWRGPNGDGARGLDVIKAAGRIGHPLGKNPGDVWPLASSSYRGAHHATFPVQLAERAIRAGCPERRCSTCRAPWRRSVQRLGQLATRGALESSCDCAATSEPGLVLDPFFGAGSTAVAAENLGRDWLGIELNPDFAEMARSRITAQRATRKTTNEVQPKAA